MPTHSRPTHRLVNCLQLHAAEQEPALHVRARQRRRRALGRAVAALVCLGVAALAAMGGAYAAAESPRVAAVYWGKPGTPDELREVARFKFVFTGLPSNKAQAQAQIALMREANPSVILATYTVLVEYWSKVDASDRVRSPTYAAIEANDWWLRNANGQRIQWTREYGTDLVNITAWAPADAQGRRYPQWLAEHKARSMDGLDGLQYVFVDNLWFAPRPRGGKADWKRTRSELPNDGEQIMSAYRQGNADFVAALRKQLPGIKIMGNADNDLDFSEFKGTLDGAFIECAMGKSWSYESTKGWAHMMAVYRKALANTTGPRDVMLHACSTDGVDWRLMRFGLASALLEDGWFAYSVAKQRPPPFADEFGAPLGAAAEPPPASASPAGVWMRRYKGGVVLVNPGKAAVRVDLGKTYRKIAGKQDPGVNDGSKVRVVTVGARDGLILLND
jgi:hypothetical protein